MGLGGMLQVNGEFKINVGYVIMIYILYYSGIKQ